MSEILNLYPTLDESGVNKAGISIQQTELSYRDDNDYYPINIEVENGDDKKFIAVLKDERCVWYQLKNHQIPAEMAFQFLLPIYLHCI